MKVLDIFEEFMTLNYDVPGEWGKTIRDVSLKEYTIARYDDDSYTIHFLLNGVSIKIDWRWLDLFSSLNVISGSRIISLANEGELDEIEEFINLFLQFQIQLDRRNGDNMLNLLSDICRVKTDKFRDFLQDRYKKVLKPIIFKSIEKVVEI